MAIAHLKFGALPALYLQGYFDGELTTIKTILEILPVVLDIADLQTILTERERHLTDEQTRLFPVRDG